MRQILVGSLLAAMFALPATAGAVNLKPGDILVAEQDGEDLGVLKVDPRTGEQSVVASNKTNPASDSDHFLDPQDLVLLPNGRILVIDDDALNESNEGAVIEVNPVTGDHRLIASNSTSTLDLFYDPVGIDVAPGGSIIVSDHSSQGVESEGAIIRVNPNTGEQSFLSTNGISDADLFREPERIEIAPDGRIIVAEWSEAGDGNGGVVAVDPATGQQSVVSNNAQSASDLFVNPSGIDVLPSGRILVSDGLGGAGGGLISVNPLTAQQTMLSDNSISDQDILDAPVDVTSTLDGRIFVADINADGGGAIVGVNPVTGEQRVISSNPISSRDSFSNPSGVVVVPPRCFGRFPTLTGSPRGDVLTGTPARDVILAGAGNDRIFGAGGNDLICTGAGADKVHAGRGHDRIHSGGGRDRASGQGGRDLLLGAAGPDYLHGGGARDRILGGAGPDELRGGLGADVLLGQKGRDLLVGAKGRDRCVGGAGRDRQRRC